MALTELDIKIVSEQDKWVASLIDPATGKEVIGIGTSPSIALDALRVKIAKRETTTTDWQITMPEVVNIVVNKNAAGRWHALYGADDQTGVAGYGRNIAEAVESWVTAWRAKVNYDR